MQTTQTEVAELVKLPAKRQARYYRLEIWPDLFGGFSLGLVVIFVPKVPI